MGDQKMNYERISMHDEVPKRIEAPHSRTQQNWHELADAIKPFLLGRGITYGTKDQSIITQVDKNAAERWPHASQTERMVYFVESLEQDIQEMGHRRMTSGDVWEVLTILERRQF